MRRDTPPTREPPECRVCKEEMLEEDDTGIRVEQVRVNICSSCESELSEEELDKEIQHALENIKRERGIECEVCHKYLLPSETSNRDPDLCENHTVEDYKARLQRDAKRRDEAMEKERSRHEEEYKNEEK